MDLLAYNVIDLFAGAGGFSLAAKNVGFNVLAAVEFEKHACDTYRSNLIEPGSEFPVVYEKDITRIYPLPVLKNLQKISNNPSLGIDVIVGGPPCQGFSTHRLNDAGIDDPRNKLLLRYFDFIKALQPKFFIVENVPGLLWPRHKSFLDRFYEFAQNAGYEVESPVVIDAKDYSVPQSRKRVFILGRNSSIAVSDNFSWPPKPTHFSPQSEHASNGFPVWKTAAAVFNTAINANDPCDIHMNHSPKMIEIFRSTPVNGGSRSQSCRTLKCHKQHSGHKDVYGRISIDRPGPTITTGCVNPSKGRFLHPFENHGITARHAARFQTFPDSFIFQGGLMAMGKQIGNAVPILLGEVVLKCIKKELDFHYMNPKGKTRK